MNPREIATIIQQQLVGTVGQMRVWSWGQSALQSLTEEDCKSLGIEDGIGGLKFSVDGHHHKGHVIVALNGLDTYNVYICNVRAGKMKVKDSIEGIYFDEFGTWIDDKVERIPEYVR